MRWIEKLQPICHRFSWAPLSYRDASRSIRFHNDASSKMGAAQMSFPISASSDSVGSLIIQSPLLERKLLFRANSRRAVSRSLS